MADIGKILVCYKLRGREKHELVTKDSELLSLVRTPNLKIKVCLKCSEMSEEEVDTLVANLVSEEKTNEADTEKAAAFVVYSELKEKFGFE